MRQSLAKLNRVHLRTKKAMTLIEVMAMILVLSIVMTAMFTTLRQGMNLQSLVQQQVQAENIAREGIEGVVNIRNTNWLRFTSNRKDCWKVKDYNADCIVGGSVEAIGDASGKSYLIFRENGLWKLENTTPFDEADNAWYTSEGSYQIYINEDGWYTATGAYADICNAFKRTECKTKFSREIQIQTKDDASDTNYEALEVTAIVRWRDTNKHSVTLQQTIANWKKNYDNAN